MYDREENDIAFRNICLMSNNISYVVFEKKIISDDVKRKNIAPIKKKSYVHNEIYYYS